MIKMRKSFKYISLIVILLLGLTYYFYNIDNTVLFSANVKKGVQKFWKTNLNIVAERNLVINGKKYKLILSTATNNKSYKYLNKYEQRLGGLYYKSLGGSKQGGSNAKINFTLINNVNSFNGEKDFTIVYGYNENLAIDNYEIKIVIGQVSSEKTIKSNISEKEYFIDSFAGHFKAVVSCTGKDGHSMISAFND